SYADSRYAARRENTLIIAVNCGRAVSTCFCTSMGTGPQASTGYDIALTEIATGTDAAFLAEAGGVRGTQYLAGLESRPARPAEITKARAITESTANQITRRLDTEGLATALRRSEEHTSELQSRA